MRFYIWTVGSAGRKALRYGYGSKGTRRAPFGVPELPRVRRIGGFPGIRPGKPGLIPGLRLGPRFLPRDTWEGV